MLNVEYSVGSAYQVTKYVCMYVQVNQENMLSKLNQI